MASNWTNGEPNNNGTSSYNATVDTTNILNVQLPVTIDNLTLLAGNIASTNSMTIRGTTTLREPGAAGAATISVNALFHESRVIDLGAIPQLSNGILDRLSLTVLSNQSNSEGVAANIRWSGADIHEITADTTVRMAGGLATITDSTTGQSAFRNLSTLAGTLAIADAASFVTSAPLSIDGTGKLNLKNASDFSVAGSVTNRGAVDVSINSSTLHHHTPFQVSGKWENYGRLTVDADGSYPGTDAQIAMQITEGMTNAGTLVLKSRSSEESSPDVFARLNLDGDLANSGMVALEGYHSDTSLIVNGNLTNSGNVNLRDATMTVRGSLLNTGTAEINGIHAPAVVAIEGGMENGGLFTADHARVTIDGDFSNTGTLRLHGSPQTSLQITGTWTQNVGGEFSAGTLEIPGYGPGFMPSPVTLAWKGANIERIGSNASIDIQGSNITLKDLETGEDAFRGLAANAGSLTLRYFDLRTPGDFENSGRLSVSDAVTNISGKFVNSGTASLGNTSVGGALENTGDLAMKTVSGSLRPDSVTNSGTFHWTASSSIDQIAGFFANTGKATFDGAGTNTVARFVFDGPLAQQSPDGTLTAGSYHVSHSYGDQASTTLSWNGAAIHRISESVSITLSGQRAGITDTATGVDALSYLTRNDGILDIENRGLTVQGALTNTNRLEVTNGDFTTGGALVNSGTVILASAAVHIAGDLDNSGVFNFTGRSTSATVQIDGGIRQIDPDGVLTAGNFRFSKGSGPTIVSWTGARITAIADNAQLYVSGVALQDSVTQSNALEQLARNSGVLQLSNNVSLDLDRDFDNPGTLSVSSTSRVSIDGSWAQNMGQHLVGGSISVGSSSVVEWNGADIRVIEKDATVSLAYNGAIRNRLTGANALANLRRNEGTFRANGDLFTLQHGFVNAGTFIVGLDGAKVLGDAVQTGDGAFRTQMLIQTWGGSTLELFGTLEVDGTFNLAGDFEIQLTLISAQVAPSDTFTIVTAGALEGVFDNVLSGERLTILEGTGSFVVTYGNGVNAIILSEYLPVPEPAIWWLLAVGGGTLLLGRWLREGRS